MGVLGIIISLNSILILLCKFNFKVLGNDQEQFFLNFSFKFV